MMPVLASFNAAWARQSRRTLIGVEYLACRAGTLQASARNRECPMLDFKIPDMTCGHCVRSVTAAVKAIDPNAELTIDLPTHHVQVQTGASRDALVAQLVEAGYTPA